MTASGGVKALALSALLAIGLGSTAQARSHVSHHHAVATREQGHSHHSASLMHGSAWHSTSWEGRRHGAALYTAAYATHGVWRHGRYRRFARSWRGGGLQCVTFARSDTGIQLSGNANTWWYHAAGVYARGTQPEPGSVLNFRAVGRMRMGHVAVVTDVVNSRTVEIDQANWGGPGTVPGGVSRGVPVVDVSPANDWSAVRVGLGHSGDFGSVYPTYGFIYNRPDNGVVLAADQRSAPIAGLNPAPSDLRSPSQIEEVAEAPDLPEPFTPHYGTRTRHRRHHVAPVALHHRRHHHY